MGEFVDYASGTNLDRVQYKLMMDAAKKRRIDVVLVWRYDRFARSTQALVNAMREFQSTGIDFISYMENIDTTCPTGELIFHVMASLAQFESSLISQRVRAGMERAKSQGKQISRPSIPIEQQEKIFDLKKLGLSMNKISKQLGIAYGTVYNYLGKSEVLKLTGKINVTIFDTIFSFAGFRREYFLDYGTEYQFSGRRSIYAISGIFRVSQSGYQRTSVYIK
jgi:DNA invertase Pin-like site-specific DNA recombinase